MNKSIISIIIVALVVIAVVVLYKKNFNKQDNTDSGYIDTEPMQTYIPKTPSYIDEAEKAEAESFRPTASIDQQSAVQ